MRAALILTHNRQELLDQAVAAIMPQVDIVLVIDNASDPRATVNKDVNLLYVPDQPPNLANLWNRGFDWFKAIRALRRDYQKLYCDQGMDIAMLCDDAIVPEGWFAAVTAAMRQTGAATGCSNPWGTPHEPRVKTAPDSDIAGRMVGWAYVIDADKELRADESMRWWWQDTSLDFESRLNGGMVMVGGYPVPNSRPGEYTNIVPGLGEQAGRDAEAFVARWGYRPW
jgi:glycosyltransferase involved in cell wall biosynthesis